jgi:hypothetical protein
LFKEGLCPIIAVTRNEYMGIGDWGLGIGDWAQSPIPNPQSPIPNPQNTSYIVIIIFENNLFYLN